MNDRDDEKYLPIRHVSRTHMGHSRLLVTYRSLDTRLALHETAERSGVSQNTLQNQGVDYWCAVVNAALDHGVSIPGLHERILALVEEEGRKLAAAAKPEKPARKPRKTTTAAEPAKKTTAVKKGEGKAGKPAPEAKTRRKAKAV